MECTKENVPKYLHWDKKPILSENDFKDEDLIYRLTKSDNPIEFPSTVTAYSCRWGKILDIRDVYNGDHSDEYDSYKYNNVFSIKNIAVAEQRTDGEDLLGFHRLTCRLLHKPTSCDYSHVEINIRHCVYESEFTKGLKALYDVTYTYDMWQESTIPLTRKGKFFKRLKNNYRLEMVKVFCLPE